MTTVRQTKLRELTESVARHYGLTFRRLQAERSWEAAEARRAAFLVMCRAVPGVTVRQMGDVVGLRWPKNHLARARRDAAACLEADAVLRSLQA